MKLDLNGLRKQFRGSTFRRLTDQMAGYLGVDTQVVGWDLTYEQYERLRVKLVMDRYFLTHAIRGPREFKDLINRFHNYVDDHCKGLKVDIPESQYPGGPPDTIVLYFQSINPVMVEHIHTGPLEPMTSPKDYYDILTEPYYEITYGKASSLTALEEAGLITTKKVSKPKNLSWRPSKPEPRYVTDVAGRRSFMF